MVRNPKTAWRKPKHLSYLRYNFGELSDIFDTVGLESTGGKTESIFLNRMPMKIKKHKHFLLFLFRNLKHQILTKLDLRYHKSLILPKQPIQILPIQTSPKIAHHNPIRIQHGYNMKYKIRSNLSNMCFTLSLFWKFLF